MKKKASEIIDDIKNHDEVKSRLKESFEKANEKSFGIIEAFFESGYHDFLAKLLVYLPEERREEALAKLPEPVRQKVTNIFEALSEKSNTAPEVLSAAGTVLKHSGFYAKACANEVTGNDFFPFDLIKKEIADCYKINPILAMNVDYYRTDFNILLSIDDRGIQKWLRDVEQMDLAMALKGSNDEVQDKVFRNMSHRAANMLREDMEFMGPVRQSDIMDKQKKLIGILEKLAGEGEIYLSRDSLIDIGNKLIN